MKIKLLLFALVLLVFNVHGQGKYFTLTKVGFINASDSSKNYVVLPIDGKTQKELYSIFLNKLNGLFVSPKDVLNPVESESISVNGLAKRQVHDTMNTAYDLNYTLVFQFKDGKIRVDHPIINKMIYYGISNYKEIYLNAGSNLFAGYTSIWNKKGLVKETAAKEELEYFFDAFIDELLNESKKVNEW